MWCDWMLTGTAAWVIAPPLSATGHTHWGLSGRWFEVFFLDSLCFKRTSQGSRSRAPGEHTLVGAPPSPQPASGSSCTHASSWWRPCREEESRQLCLPAAAGSALMASHPPGVLPPARAPPLPDALHCACSLTSGPGGLPQELTPPSWLRHTEVSIQFPGQIREGLQPA